VIRRVTVVAALVVATVLLGGSSVAPAKKASCEMTVLLETGLTEEEAKAGVAPQRAVDACNYIRAVVAQPRVAG